LAGPLFGRGHCGGEVTLGKQTSVKKGPCRATNKGKDKKNRMTHKIKEKT